MTSNGSGPPTSAPAGPAVLPAGAGGRFGRRERPQAAPPVLAPKTRRRTGVLAAGVALVVVGALGAAYLTQVVGNTVEVVAVARDVGPGELIERVDLTLARVSTDPALDPVPADRLAGIVGQRAAVALTAGSLLTDAAVTDQVLPAAGQSLVGVALQPAQLPAEPLRAGDRIRIVDTPTSQADPPATTPPTIPAIVVATAGPDDSGLMIVDVTVPSGQAADLAGRVATGRIALILDSRER